MPYLQYQPMPQRMISPPKSRHFKWFTPAPLTAQSRSIGITPVFATEPYCLSDISGFLDCDSDQLDSYDRA